MNKPTKLAEKTKRVQQFIHDINEDTGVYSFIKKSTGQVLGRFRFDDLPAAIQRRAGIQGMSTILQQRKASKDDELQAMEAAFARWMIGEWEAERKAPRHVPSWAIGALVAKYPQHKIADLIKTLANYQATLDNDAWANFIAGLEKHKTTTTSGGEVITLD